MLLSLIMYVQKNTVLAYGTPWFSSWMPGEWPCNFSKEKSSQWLSENRNQVNKTEGASHCLLLQSKNLDRHCSQSCLQKNQQNNQSACYSETAERTSLNTTISNGKLQKTERIDFLAEYFAGIQSAKIICWARISAYVDRKRILWIQQNAASWFLRTDGDRV